MRFSMDFHCVAIKYIGNIGYVPVSVSSTAYTGWVHLILAPNQQQKLHISLYSFNNK